MESEANGLSSNSKDKNDWGEVGGEGDEGPQSHVLQVLSRPGSRIGTALVMINVDGWFGLCSPEQVLWVEV